MKKKEPTANDYISQFVGSMIDDNLVDAKKYLENAILEQFTNMIKNTNEDLNKE